MIIRILHEGQYELADELADELERQDAPLEAAMQAGDDIGFAAALDAVITWVRAHATHVDVETLVPSGYVLPAPATPLAEVKELLDSEAVER